jgi:hypothetical protein
MRYFINPSYSCICPLVVSAVGLTSRCRHAVTRSVMGDCGPTTWERTVTNKRYFHSKRPVTRDRAYGSNNAWVLIWRIILR